ncbi:MAG: HNH endonuclease [Oscillospiraceae bacterium]|nr:MAG: HNH endonuclease [Oscillospiraceae bacterium]
MSKYKTIDVWNRVFGAKQEAHDYTGRLMKKSACGNSNSAYHPTLDHIRPLSAGGCDVPETSSFAIVIPTRKKQITSRTGKRTARVSTPSE